MPKTILAIDWGKKRIGVARADTQAKIPEPAATVPHTEDIHGHLRQMAQEENAATIVVGLPRNLSGEETQQSREVRQFADALQQAVQCDVMLQDETLTSHYIQYLQKQYPDAGTDSLAAVIILEDYLRSV